MDTSVPTLPAVAMLGITILLPMIGRLCKELPFIPDRLIPTVLSFLGGLVAAMIAGWTWPNFLAGLIAGGAAVGVNQQFRQVVSGTGRSTADSTMLCIPLMACLIFLPSCKTTGPVDPVAQDTSIKRTAAIVEMGATLGTYYACKQDENARAYFETAASVIALLANDGTFDPAALQTALQGISVKELRSEDAYLAIASTVALYQSYYQDAVSQKLDQNAYCKPVLAALVKGIKTGLSPTGTAERYPELVKP